ncbi:MAG TPA: LysR substrate-binding domain-containing protein [Steroidobacteraceae bacterium]|nr:LysR substrate-binding domain-containing protein [Steroidobacteraceae bacterium]
MNLHLLRIFAAVAEQRSFSRAASTLFISQPAVSKAVRQLEHQLDLALIERGPGGTRGTRGVRLTESGQALFEHARGIFALERAATDEVRARVGLKRGRLVVGASTTIAGYWLPRYLARFARQVPSAELQVRVGNTQTVGRALIDCETDLALVEGPVDDQRIAATHWRDDELQIIAHPEAGFARRRGAALGELNAQAWLLREPGSGTREVTDRVMRAQRIEPGRTIEFASNEGIARAVAAGLGLALLPACVVRELVRMGEVRTLTQTHTNGAALLRPLYLLQLRERPPSPLAREFCTLLTRSLETR